MSQIEAINVVSTDADYESMVRGVLDLKVSQAEEWAADYDRRQQLASEAEVRVQAAYEHGDRLALADIHRGLDRIYRYAFSLPEMDGHEAVPPVLLEDLASPVERAMLSHEEQFVRSELDDVPRDGHGHVEWLRGLIRGHQASRHPVYRDFLAKKATLEHFRHYFIQESTLDPRFDDILALIQVGTSGGVKMELASNYWDEMGNGDPDQVHTHLFGNVLEGLDITPAEMDAGVTLEALVCGNLSACLGLRRPHFGKALGYFGVTEFLAPSRFRYLLKGWDRLSQDPDILEYHRVHIDVDVAHAKGWFNEAIRPLIDQNPNLSLAIARGALYRLNSSERYLDAMLAHFTAQS